MDNSSLVPKSRIGTTFYAFSIVGLLIFALIYFSGIFKPLVIAILVWFIINQVKLSIEKIKIKGKVMSSFLSTALAFLLITIVSFILGKLVISNLESILLKMPTYMDELNSSLENDRTSNEYNYLEYVENVIASIDVSAIATLAISSITDFIASFLMVLVYVIFFLLEDSTQRGKLTKLFPNKEKEFTVFIQNLSRIKDAINSYLWSKTLISLITAGISWIILYFMKVEYAVLWAFLIFVFNFIPYIGPLISSFLPSVFTFIVSADVMQFIYVFAAMGVVQVILGNFIEPMLMGKGSNLGPVAVVISLAFWGMIWGIVGMVLAIPITSIFVIILSQYQSTRFIAILLSERGDIISMDE